MPIDLWIRFRTQEDGAVAVIVSLMLTVLIGFVALGVDVASLYRDRARLQVASDMTAMSVMADPDAATRRARDAVVHNDRAAETITTLQMGRFLRNPAIPPSERFVPLATGEAGINAVQVVLTDDSPLHFARIFSDATKVSLNRTAIATRTGAASFSLDSYLVGLDGAALNSLLTQEFGATAQIDLGAMTLLAQAQINLGDLLAGLGAGGANPAEILDGTVAISDLVAAIRAQLPAAPAAALSGLETSVSGQTIDVAALVGGMDSELGLTATEFLGDMQLPALDLVKAIAAAQAPDQPFDLGLEANIAGLLSAEAHLSAGEPPAQSGWIALGEEGVQLHRAAARLSLDLAAGTDLLGDLGTGIQVTSLNLPVHVELAGATATLDEISCSGSAPSDLAASFLVAPTPLHPANGTSVAALYLGTLPAGTGASDLIDPSELGFADLLTVQIVIEVPLLPDVTLADLVIQARSHVTVGSSAQERITYTRGEVAPGDTVRSYGSEQLLTSAVEGLLSPDRTEFRIKPGQEGLVSGLAAPVVNGLLASLPAELLTSLTSPLDSVIDNALGLTGLELGAGELTLTGHHCELIRLIR